MTEKTKKIVLIVVIVFLIVAFILPLAAGY